MSNPRPIQVCLLGASLNTANMGVSALASGAVTSVRAAFPQARVFIYDYAREPAVFEVQCPDGPTTVEQVNIRFSKKLLLPNNIAWLLVLAMLARLVPVAKWRASWLARNPWLKRLLEADLVASIAGGDSFSDIYGMGRLLYVALPQILVLLLKRPLVLLPQTIGPFKTWAGRWVAGFILRRAAVVYSRDRTSFAEAEPLMGPGKERLRFSHDMAFVMKPVPPAAEKLAQLPERDGTSTVVGLNVSGLLWMGGYDGKNMFGLKTDYVELTRKLIDHFVRECRAHVVLVPHVFGNSAECDTAVCAQLYEEWKDRAEGRLHLLHGDFNQHEIKYAIGRCDFFLGARMHACIAALSQTVPAVCLAYSRKFIGVMESIDCAELAVNLCELDTGQTLAAVKKIYSTREDFQKSLRARIPGVQAGVSGLFKPENSGLIQGTAEKR